MAKPWAKLEVGFLGHPKFLSLTANAICLWLEGKDYCDTHLTDGLIPREAVKHFRFRGAKSVNMLTHSCGPKGDGTPYAPLWERHDVGFKMHDYLDYNDCREAVLDRVEKADANKAANRERLKRWRDAQKKRDRETQDETRCTNADVTLSTATTSVSAAASAPASPKPKEQVSDSPSREGHFDRWLHDVQNGLYPAHRVTRGYSTMTAFVDAMEGFPGGPEAAWQVFQDTLDANVHSHEWRVKGMVPRLEKYLRDGLWQNPLPADAPAAEQLSPRTMRMMESA